MKRQTLLAGVAMLAAQGAAAQDAVDLGTLVLTETATLAPLALERAGASVEVLEPGDFALPENRPLAEGLATLPGVSLAANGGPGAPVDLRVRGAGLRYVPVYVDGILVTDPAGTNVVYNDLGALGTGLIERAELLKGSQSALYGPSAVGGVLDIATLPRDVPEGLSGRARLGGGSFGTVTGALQLNQRQGPLTLSLGLSHDRSEGISAAQAGDPDLGTPGAVNDEADGYDRTRLAFGATYVASETVTLGLNGFVDRGETEFDEFYSDDRNNNAAPTFNFADDINGYVDGTPDERTERDAWALRAFAEVRTGAWTHDIALSTYRIDRLAVSPTVSGPDSTPFRSEFDARRDAIDYAVTGQIGAAWRLSFGLDARRETVRAGTLAGGSQEITQRGLFAEALWSPSASLDVTATLRHDDHSAFGGETTGRLAAAWRATDALTLRGAAATGYRPPSIDELFGTYPGFVGNPDLQPERSRSAEIGLDYAFAGGARLGATLFRIDIDNLVQFAFAQPVSSLRNVPDVTRREGLELAVAVPLGERVSLTGAATILHTDDGQGRPLQRVPGREFALGVEAAATDRLDLGLLVRHVADRPQDTDASFSRVDMDDYTVVDLSMDYALTDTLTAYVKVHNATDESYQTIPGYGTSPRAWFFGIDTTF